MDNRLRPLGFADKHPPLNAFETLSKVGYEAEYCTDITLRLESPGSSTLYSCNLKGTKRKWGDIIGAEGPKHASLDLGLGRPKSSSDSSKRSSATVCTMSSAKEADEESSIDLSLSFQHLSYENTLSRNKSSVNARKKLNNEPILDLQLSLSVRPSESDVTSIAPAPAHHQHNFGTSGMVGHGLSGDEGSTSSCWNYGSHLIPNIYTAVAPGKFCPGLTLNEGSTLGMKYVSHQIQTLYTSEAASGFPPSEQIHVETDLFPIPDLSSTITPVLKSPVACISGVTQQRQANTATKKCLFHGCGKGARGASGLCIAHGGGRRCQKADCQKGAEGRTIYCKAHGGGRRCQHLGCTKSAEGRTDHCIAHGGGRRCTREGCTRAARGKSGLCIRHGGGKRCEKENCTRSAEGYSGLCISHGGGRRCQYPECSKGAQGGTMFCKAHGGGKRCTFLGCMKGAEGSTPFCKGHGGGKRCSFQGGCPKSVHGGTQFCVAHGGGKRCAMPECTKSARGRTDFCVRHGGGKRCQFEGCGKSAQGSTDFCKAHGGGKRCLWGQLYSGNGGPPCDRFARGKTGLCAAHNALVQDQRVHGEAMLGPVAAHSLMPGKPEKMKGIAFEENVFSEAGNGVGSTDGWDGLDQKKLMHQAIPGQSRLVSLPEGRVHGGRLMAILGSSASIGSHSGDQVGHGTSESWE